jgi:hypothetical protein
MSHDVALSGVRADKRLVSHKVYRPLLLNQRFGRSLDVYVPIRVLNAPHITGNQISNINFFKKQKRKPSGL